MKIKPLVFIILLFSLLFLSLRFSNFSSKLEFSYDQGFHLIDSLEIIKTHKLRMIGPEVTSKIFQGRQFYIGPHYYYILSILGFITNWDPVKITGLIVIVEYFFFLFLIKYIYQKFGLWQSLITAILFAISPYFVSHARFFWNPHFILPVSILFIIYFNNLFLASILWGIAFSFHYTAILWVIPLLISLINQKKFNLKNILIILAGFIIGDLPFFIFELRHNFYNLKTIFLVFSNFGGTGSSSPHYFIYPLFILIFWGLLLLSKKYKIPFYLLILLFLLFKADPGLDQIKGWTYQEQLKVRDIILKDTCPKNYNIAATMQGDTRFHSLRFLLIRAKCPPIAEDNYQDNQILYLVAPKHRTPETENVWEVASMRPFIIEKTIPINNEIILYTIKRK